MSDASFRTKVQPRPSGKDRTLSLSLGLLLLSGGLALAKGLGQGLADLQAGHQIRTFYVAVLAYEYAALPITGSIFLAWVLLVAVGLRRLHQPRGRQTALIAGGVTSLALLWAGLSTFPQLFVGYEHLKSMTMGAEDYYLGIRTALDGDFFFVVTQCPHRQLRCAAYGVAAVDAAERADLSHVRLATDTTQALVIQTASRTIPGHTPAP
jgi:hypothetical protein